jgi:magnesium chelatase subunit D
MNGASAWALAMRAQALFIHDPVGLGGIVLRAGAGPVRDAWLQQLRDNLAPNTPLRRIPAGVTDDRLLGALDLAETLRLGRPMEQSGILAESDGGIVVLPMAERLEADVAARLTTTMDTGFVSSSRDGVSRKSAARFGVVALDESATPEEHVTDALRDRLALHVDLTAISWRDVGGNAVSGQLGPVRMDADDSALVALSEAALALGIASLRPPLLALRVARAAAGLFGSGQIGENELALAAQLVLAPRATCLPSDPTVEDEQSSSVPPDGPDQRRNASGAEPLADVVVDAALSALPANLLTELQRRDGAKTFGHAAGRAGPAKSSLKRGRPVGTRKGSPASGARLHVLETLKAAVPWQALRRGAGNESMLHIRREDFRVVRFRQPAGTTMIFTVDASGSAARQRLGEVKGAVELLLADAYVRRDKVALISFRGEEADLLLPPTGSLTRAKRCLAALPGGGPTPLAAGIEATVALAGSIQRTGRAPMVTLLTDGRANIARDGSHGRPHAEAEALDSARLLRTLDVATLVVDTSPRPNPFARRLADVMHARYLPLPYVDPSVLSRAVRSTAAPC